MLRPSLLLRQLRAAIGMPAGDEPAAPAPAAQSQPAGPLDLDGRRVLVVEDNEVNLILLQLQLETLGVAAQIAHSGAEAVEAFRGACWDIVLMDIEMPQMDGMQATAAIRRMLGDAGDQPYVVAVTAHVFGDTKQRMEDAGMDDFVSKPVLVGELVKALQRGAAALRARDRRQAASARAGARRD